jgi:hypothetical protein
VAAFELLKLSELNQRTIDHPLHGAPVKIDGLGTSTPAIRIDGSPHLNVRIDRSLIHALDGPGAFKGKVINRRSIGLSSNGLIALWERHHPGDPIAKQVRRPVCSKEGAFSFPEPTCPPRRNGKLSARIRKPSPSVSIFSPRI